MPFLAMGKAKMGTGGELLRGGGDSQEKIFVSVRVRPLSEKEIANNDLSDWECINENTILYKNVHAAIAERTIYPAAYTFGRVFGEDRSTREVYEQGAKEVTLAVVRGINSSVLAYGQTSSGKTYTMSGIIRYSLEDIFKYMKKHTERKFVLKFSAMEIYNESIRDLLSVEATPLRLLDDPERGTIVDNLIEETIRDYNHLLELVSFCAEQRQIGETYINENSSRSHQIIRLTVESCAREFLGKNNLGTLTGTVNFVDLAGSETASQSLTAGTWLKEGTYINRSLLTLSTVIRKLSHGRNGHIPYRDSKLTRILQPSLGGNARTALICTLSPTRTHVEQSRNTLLFASCAREVTTSAQVNVVISDNTLVKHLQRELTRLEIELRTPGSSSAVLHQKDLQIEMLEKEVKDLILQRDIAQSQLKEVLRLYADDTDSPQQFDVGNYPSLRVRVSPESASTELRDSSDRDFASCSAYTRCNSTSFFTPGPNFVETPQTLDFTSCSAYSRCNSGSVGGWDKSEIQSSGTSNDFYKEVWSVEKDDHSSKTPVKSSYLDPEKVESISGLKGYARNNEENQRSPLSLANRDGELPSSEVNNRGVVSNLTRKHQQRPSVSLEEVKMESSFTEEKDLISVHEDVSSYAKLSPEKDADSLSNWLDKRTAYQSESAEKEADQNLEKVADQRPSIAIRHVKIISPTPSLPRSPVDSNVEEFNKKSSLHKDTGDIDSCQLVLKEVVGDRGKADNKKEDVSVQSFRESLLNHIEDEYRSLQSWPAEFQMLRQEIIDLWDTCHASLLHRTHFFLLFQGDPTDAIYMAVELRKLTSLKDTFARGEKTVIGGKKMSLDLSKKIVRQERTMLSKQMLKKFSSEERDMLFLKWGIGIDTKLRRMQLANRLWTNTEDMSHIQDSACLVAKLLGFTVGDQTPEEVFRLELSPKLST